VRASRSSERAKLAAPFARDRRAHAALPKESSMTSPPRSSMGTRALVLLLVLALSALSACRAAVTEEQLREATLYVPPEFKYVAEPRFSFSPAERQLALQFASRNELDTIFELVIDSEGRVQRVRLVRTTHPERRHEDMLVHARGFVFSKGAQPGLYRAFYYPLDYSMRLSFEWQ